MGKYLKLVPMAQAGAEFTDRVPGGFVQAKALGVLPCEAKREFGEQNVGEKRGAFNDPVAIAESIAKFRGSQLSNLLGRGWSAPCRRAS